jgi:mono/diheme cytochrome c family protein
MYNTMRQFSTQRRAASRAVVAALFSSLLGLFGTAAWAADGSDIFKAKCAACHGADASGNTPLGKRFNIPDLRSPAVQKQTDQQMGEFIENGKPPMPPFKASLSADEVHGVVTFIRSIAKK